MKWTVVYRKATETELANLWNNAADRAAITAAANAIDQLLAKNPLGVGESRDGGQRILVVPPLAVKYDVFPDDVKVIIWQVWRWGSAGT